MQRAQVPPFKVVWLASDTSASFNYLAQNAADVSITYHAVAESVAMQQGIADRCEYAWRDHWMLVGEYISRFLRCTALEVKSSQGPKSNPAQLPTDGKQSIYALFAQIFRTAVDSTSSKEPVRFLSRYDKSAANIAESRIWATIGQAPWAHPYSPWYHRFLDFPFQALRAASKLGEYTIMDRGTWCAIEPEVRDAMAIFVRLRLSSALQWGQMLTTQLHVTQAAGNDTSEADPLLNAAHALIGAYGMNKAMATSFVDWMVEVEGGQKTIRDFTVNGEVLYTCAPPGVDPLTSAKGILGLDPLTR